MAILGSAIALVVAQITGAMNHDVRISMEISSQTAADLDRIEMAVLEKGEPDPVSLTIFRFDERHRPGRELRHTLQLTNGRYALAFKLYRSSNAQPLRVSKQLEVSGDVAVRYGLP